VGAEGRRVGCSVFGVELFAFGREVGGGVADHATEYVDVGSAGAVEIFCEQRASKLVRVISLHFLNNVDHFWVLFLLALLIIFGV
jgi:hypothetical protein